MPRILALLPYPTGSAPGQRYRVEQWAPFLEAEGLPVVLSPFLPARAMGVLYDRGHVLTKALATLTGYAGRLGQLRDLRNYDLFFVYREATLLGPSWLEELAARHGPIVFDFDDAIFLREVSQANRWAGRLRPPGKTAALCRMAKHVTVGNDTLASFARQHNPNVTVIPSTIDTATYTLQPRRPNPRPVLGWTGSPTTAKYLEALHPVLLELRAAVDFEMLVVGARVELPGIDVRYVPWNASTEVADLRPIDVGLMPLSDDPWSRGKSGMKALQYMALAIPPVVSPVGANREIVRDGCNGFHASSAGEWIERIALLARDQCLRRLGAEARTVERNCSAAVQAPRLARVLRDALKDRQIPGDAI
jgi:glycosyltransferase involved in cell wall biosynthesis